MSIRRVLTFGLGIGLGIVLGAGVVMAVSRAAGWSFGGDDRSSDVLSAQVTTVPANPSTTVPSTAAPSSSSTTSSTTTTSTTLPDRQVGTAPGWTVGMAWGQVAGVTMFRGNPTRTYYGAGEIPDDPEVLWRYPDKAMCGASTHHGEPKTWCGTGWTGQPIVWLRPDGVTEIIFGSYDKSVHFVDAATGEPTRPRFVVGDIVKGSPTLDPDGFPLLYFGARDNKLRIVALDRETPTELWSYDAYNDRVVWNDDWDSNPLIVDDVMYEGGENGWFYAFGLGRAYDASGLVKVDPGVLLKFPMFTDELLASVGRELSIENSVAMYEDRVYFGNSGGRVVGLDVSNIEDGEAPLVFDYWLGDDVDATITIDRAGKLYVAIELERFNARSEEVGQLVKLDPDHPEDPVVWSVAVPAAAGDSGGIWATPALGDGVLYVATHPGELLAVDTSSGDVVWRDAIGFHAWSSPVVVGDRLLVAVDCVAGGGLRAYDLTDAMQPNPLWETRIGSGCIESTPVVWNERIYVGSRDGFFYAFG